jgi:hypothetical protein
MSLPGPSRAEGLLYTLPEDGAWVPFGIDYTFRGEGVEHRPTPGSGV